MAILDKIEEFWPGFGIGDGLPDVVCEASDGLAKAVLDFYNIPFSSNSPVDGGTLDDLDIKHMDAIQLIKLSLLESSADNSALYEPTVNEDGEVEFIEIGSSVFNSGDSCYYEVQTGSYNEECVGVMVFGKKPLAFRKQIEWLSAWTDEDVEIFDCGKMFNNDCLKKGFNQYSTILYKDPQLTTNYNDGIDNLYEIDTDNPWETVTGYAHFIDWPSRDSYGIDKNVSVTQQNSSRVLVELDLNGFGLGTLYRRPNTDPNITENLACSVNEEEVSFEDGVQISPEEYEKIKKFRFQTVRGVEKDAFTGISNVYAVGLLIADLHGEPPSDLDAVAQSREYGSANVWASIEDTKDQLFVLNEGEHYAVAYSGYDPVEPSIVFADNSLVTDPIGFAPREKTSFFITPGCAYFTSLGDAAIGEHEGYVLPYAKRQGILVKQLFVVINLETPSIEIYHPQGVNNRAREIAESLEYLIAPLVTINEPQPIGFAGKGGSRLIDQATGKQDHDPTTAQDFSVTDLEEAMDDMALGSGQTLNLTFLEKDQVLDLAQTLYNYLNAGDGIESTYVCGPDAEPRLGDLADNGGIVNGITYSYQDSNSYTISVNAGPKTAGNFASPGIGGPSFKASEDLTCQGTVVQDLGNGIHYKVLVDGLGERIAVNMIPSIIRSGDVVSVAVHNNPVEA